MNRPASGAGGSGTSEPMTLKTYTSCRPNQMTRSVDASMVNPWRIECLADFLISQFVGGEQPGEDPFTKMEEDKKLRVASQDEREARNALSAAKKGGKIPASVKLTSSLPEHGKGNPLKRKGLEREVTIWILTTEKYPKMSVPVSCEISI